MKKLQKKFILTTLFLFVTLITIFYFANPLIAMADRREHADNISLNEIRTMNLTIETMIYYFTPDASCYYIVETYSTKPTKLKVSSLAATGHKESTGYNVKIEIKSTQVGQWKIYVELEDKSESCEVSLQIRKHTFSMFGYEAKDIDTVPFLEVPYNKLKDIYNVVKYENSGINPALFDNDSRGLSAINSELVLFAGHGYSDGSGIIFYKNGKFSGHVVVGVDMDMSKTKIAMWAACSVASSDNSYNLSFAEYSVKCGALSSVGFKRETSVSSAKKFTNTFFTKLSEGANVQEAAKKAASSVIWAWDAAKDYQIFGNLNTTIAECLQQTGTFSLNNKDYIDIEEKLNQDYAEFSVGENELRYYKLINGYESTDYIDVIKENGRIVSVKDECRDYFQVLEINEDFLSASATQSINIDSNIYKLKEEAEEHIIYYNFDGVMTPVKVSFCTYVDDNGNSVYEADCINLYNGEHIDYADINSIE